MEQQKLYVVWKPDTNRGIYEDWPSCQKATNRVPSAEHCAVYGRQEAERALSFKTRAEYKQSLPPLSPVRTTGLPSPVRVSPPSVLAVHASPPLSLARVSPPPSALAVSPFALARLAVTRTANNFLPNLARYKGVVMHKGAKVVGVCKFIEEYAIHQLDWKVALKDRYESLETVYANTAMPLSSFPRQQRIIMHDAIVTQESNKEPDSDQHDCATFGLLAIVGLPLSLLARELLIELPFPGEDKSYLVGSVDALFWDHEVGCLVLADYKTLELNDDGSDVVADFFFVKRQHVIQMHVYAAMLETAMHATGFDNVVGYFLIIGYSWASTCFYRWKVERNDILYLQSDMSGVGRVTVNDSEAVPARRPLPPNLFHMKQEKEKEKMSSKQEE